MRASLKELLIVSKGFPFTVFNGRSKIIVISYNEDGRVFNAIRVRDNKKGFLTNDCTLTPDKCYLLIDTTKSIEVENKTIQDDSSKILDKQICKCIMHGPTGLMAVGCSCGGK